jgi:outer membrane protein assembly factor BamD
MKMVKTTYISSLLLIILLTLGACNNIEKLQKSKDFTGMLKKANELYDAKKYSDANILYETLLPVFKGTSTFEDLYYKYAYTFYNQKNYIAASYHFKSFTEFFSKSTRAEECEYMMCICLHKMSPSDDLDQTTTAKAIASLQTFLNNHPESKHAEEANKIIDEARLTLESKEEKSAALYYRINQFRAAGVAYKNLIKKFPDSPKGDFYQYMVMVSNYKFATLSVNAKKEERFNQALSDYNELLENFPKTNYKNEADKLKTTIFADLKTLKQQQ